LSLSLDERINPAAITDKIRYSSSGAYILKHSMSISPISAPAPEACTEIIHLKLIRVITSERKKTEKMNDFTKNGIGNLRKIYDVVA
jgi:hypothetical protein